MKSRDISFMVSFFLSALVFIGIVVTLISIFSTTKKETNLIQDLGKLTREIKEDFDKGYNDSTKTK